MLPGFNKFLRIKVLTYVLITIFLILISILLTNFFDSYYQIGDLSESINKSYVSDEMSFLKTFYLMKKGDNYYLAFKLARENLNRTDNLSSDPSVWRLPTVFYLWSIFLNNGIQILNLFIFLSLISLISIFLLVKKITNKYLGFISTLFFVPFMLDTLRYKTAFLFTEWWGLFFYLFGLTFLIFKKNKLAVVFLTLAVLTRELFIIPVTLIFLVQIFKKLQWKIYLLPLISFLILYLFHQHNISQFFTNNSAQFKLLNRIHGFSIFDLQQMLSFSMRYYVLDGFKTHFIFLLLGFVAIILNLIRSREIGWVYLLASVVWGIFLLPTISVADNNYWGIMFTPFLLISAPLILNFFRSEKNSKN